METEIEQQEDSSFSNTETNGIKLSSLHLLIDEFLYMETVCSVLIEQESSLDCERDNSKYGNLDVILTCNLFLHISLDPLKYSLVAFTPLD